jgi:hypothetical protein
MAAFGKGAVGKEVFDRGAFGKAEQRHSSLLTMSASLTKSTLTTVLL